MVWRWAAVLHLFLSCLRIFLLYEQVRLGFAGLILVYLCFLNYGSNQKSLGFGKSRIVPNVAYQCNSWWGGKCLSLGNICESNPFLLLLLVVSKVSRENNLVVCL